MNNEIEEGPTTKFEHETIAAVNKSLTFFNKYIKFNTYK
jgi:hypothetical protein